MLGKRHIVVPDMWPGKPPLAFLLAVSLKAVEVLAVGSLAALAYAEPAYAEDMGARSLASGGVGLADGKNVAGEELNLSAAALDPSYVVYGGAEVGPDKRFLARSGAVDSRTSAVALGAGYRWMMDNVPPAGAELPGWKPADTELSNLSTTQRVHLGLAVPFLERRLAIGAHTRFDWKDSALTGTTNAFNFGFSVAGRPIPTLTVAAGARNLLTSAFTSVTREADLAVRFDPGPYLGLEADVSAPIEGPASAASEQFGVDTFRWRAGADVSATSWLALRGGWSLVEDHHYAHAGLGLVSDKATLDYGVKVQLDMPSRNWHALDLRINF